LESRSTSKLSREHNMSDSGCNDELVGEDLNNRDLDVEGNDSELDDRLADDDYEMQSEDQYMGPPNLDDVQGIKIEPEDDAKYYEPIDPTKEGVYIVHVYDDNTAKARWKCDDISKMKVNSPIFEIGGYSWSLLCFPRGNNVSQLSIYLACEGENKNSSWSRFAKFQLNILNQKVRTFHFHSNHL